MNDVQRQDRKLFFGELFKPYRLALLFAVVVPLCFIFWDTKSAPLFLLSIIVPSVVWAISSYSASVGRRFQDKKYEALWNGCKDRLSRFEDVLGRSRKEQIADLREMPKTIRRVSESLYLALRRADMIACEVQRTERGVYAAPPAWQARAQDPQATELYRIADKNIAEYRSQFQGVMAGVHRAEAQSAVFMTTLDSLRMKLIGYRLVGRSPEMSSQDFLEALGEAKIQLNAIDQALDELDFSHLPKTIAVVQPAQDQVQQGN